MLRKKNRIQIDIHVYLAIDVQTQQVRMGGTFPVKVFVSMDKSFLPQLELKLGE